MDIKQVTFPASQYFQEEHPKKQIYLHHTAGNANGEQVFAGWASNSERIGTCVSISGNGKGTVDGQIIQGFSSKHWAYHLGLKQDVFTKAGVKYQSLDKISIGIEICNWGQLTLKDGKFYNYVNREVPASEVCTLDKPYKGFKYYHNYTDAQIASVKELLLLWKEKYKIPLSYSEDIWDISKRALSGEPGVYTHNSVRKDKVDIYPHPKMIEMLKSLS
jgi:N-acetyl-anhydromuramyl-L-alanine amidase AmpD